MPALSILPLSPTARSYRREDYVVTDANREALAWIDAWKVWPVGVMILTGEADSGKSHLASLWQEQANATRVTLPCPTLPTASALLLEDVPSTPPRSGQEALVHLYNSSREQQKSLLITSRTAFWHQADMLPDLVSRLSTAVHVPLEQPDEPLLEALLYKHAADRQLLLPEEAASYLLPRLTRGYAAVGQIIATLDNLSLQAGRRISIPLVKQALQETGHDD